MATVSFPRLVGVVLALGVGAAADTARAEEPTWSADLWAAPSPVSAPDEEVPNGPLVRHRGRVGVGAGVGAFDFFGLMASLSAHVFVHPRVVLEGEFAYGAAAVPYTESSVEALSANASWRFLLRDTFNVRLGLAARQITTTAANTSGRDDAQARDVAWLVTLGNRWDRKNLFVTADWIGLSQPLRSLRDARLTRPIEVRAAHVTVGVAF